jgi:hypothetical protein
VNSLSAEPEDYAIAQHRCHEAYDRLVFTGSVPLTIAALLAVTISAVHSYLGERYLIQRLLKRDDLPRLLGDDTFTRRVIRFAWHLTSVAWTGMGVVLVVLANHQPSPVAVTAYESGANLADAVAGVIAITFLVSAVMTAVVSRLRHLAWIVFLAIGVLALVG